MLVCQNVGVAVFLAYSLVGKYHLVCPFCVSAFFEGHELAIDVDVVKVSLPLRDSQRLLKVNTNFVLDLLPNDVRYVIIVPWTRDFDCRSRYLG